LLLASTAESPEKVPRSDILARKKERKKKREEQQSFTEKVSKKVVVANTRRCPATANLNVRLQRAESEDGKGKEEVGT